MAHETIDGTYVAHHLAQNIDLAVVAAADLSALRAHARTRGWQKLRLLSAGDSTFKYDQLDLTPQGSKDWDASLSYGTEVRWRRSH